MDIDEIDAFSYVPPCTAPGCPHPAAFKVAAAWSDGTSRELKNYGLACEDHLEAQAARARAARDCLTLAEGECVGPVRVFRLAAGCRDADLSPLSDRPSTT